jgi:hypothetical protein
MILFLAIASPRYFLVVSRNPRCAKPLSYPAAASVSAYFLSLSQPSRCNIPFLSALSRKSSRRRCLLACHEGGHLWATTRRYYWRPPPPPPHQDIVLYLSAFAYGSRFPPFYVASSFQAECTRRGQPTLSLSLSWVFVPPLVFTIFMALFSLCS